MAADFRFCWGGDNFYACVEQVSIPSQRRYVGYWNNIISFSRGVHSGPPDVNLPKKCSRELLRIRLYDTINTNAVFFVVSELQEVSSPNLGLPAFYWGESLIGPICSLWFHRLLVSCTVQQWNYPGVLADQSKKEIRGTQTVSTMFLALKMKKKGAN